MALESIVQKLVEMNETIMDPKEEVRSIGIAQAVRRANPESSRCRDYLANKILLLVYDMFIPKAGDHNMII